MGIEREPAKEKEIRYQFKQHGKRENRRVSCIQKGYLIMLAVAFLTGVAVRLSSLFTSSYAL
ncbi:hypothetical protein EDM55_28170 [Brevibacillus centrosporus]|nr:hypothetical protein EDM55_28170 [Brevibacillus centrosporus]